MRFSVWGEDNSDGAEQHICSWSSPTLCALLRFVLRLVVMTTAPLPARSLLAEVAGTANPDVEARWSVLGDSPLVTSLVFLGWDTPAAPVRGPVPRSLISSPHLWWLPAHQHLLHWPISRGYSSSFTRGMLLEHPSSSISSTWEEHLRWSTPPGGSGQQLPRLYIRRDIEREAGLIMDIPAKRMLGTWCLWLGIYIFAGLGLVVVPRHKLVRATSAIRRTASRRLQFDEYCISRSWVFWSTYATLPVGRAASCTACIVLTAQTVRVALARPPSWCPHCSWHDSFRDG